MMCPFEEFPNKNKYMDYNLFVKCVDEGSNHGLEVIDVCLMGDSLLDPGFKDKMEYIRTKYPYMKVYASSQGMSADPDLVCSYVDTLHVSFYGTTKEVYERIHGGGVKFEKALKNVEDILKKEKGKRPYVVLTFLMLPENEYQMGEWIEKWEPVADEVIVWKPHNWAGLYDSSTRNFVGETVSCGRPINGSLCVWVNGDVTPCCFSWDKRMIIGDANKESLEQIYFGQRRKEIIEKHTNGRLSDCDLPCERCDQIFSRSDALVYTNHGRAVGEAIYGDTRTVRFKGDA